MPTEKNFTAQSKPKSSEKEKVDGQTFRLSIWNGIFEHCSKIKDAIWLFLLYINWTTEEVEPDEETVQSSELGGDAGLEGVVRGGIVVSDGVTAKGIPGTTRKTTLRWRERLALNGFITQDRKNYGYVIRVLKSKKWDADGAEGTFRIPVSTGILDHYKKLKSSVWLLFWYIDKTTKEPNGEGLVLGGKPVLDSVAAGVLGVSNDTIAAWRENLERHGYIRARRTPYGHVIYVAKSKKWVGKKSQKPKSQMSQNPVSLTGKTQNSTSEMSHFPKSDVPFSQVRCPDLPGQMSQKPGNKEDIAVDFTETGKGQNSTAASAFAVRGTASPCDPLLTEKSVEDHTAESWQALEQWGVKAEGDEVFRKCWSKAYHAGGAASGNARLLQVMNLVVQFHEEREMQIPESFLRIRSLVEKAIEGVEEAQWKERMAVLEAQKRRLFEKYPEAATCK